LSLAYKNSVIFLEAAFPGHGSLTQVPEKLLLCDSAVRE
jgi:hypothetical protein